MRKLSRIRVDEDIKKKLKAEAAAAGMSLQDYLAEKLSKDSKKGGGYRGVF